MVMNALLSESLSTLLGKTQHRPQNNTRERRHATQVRSQSTGTQIAITLFKLSKQSMLDCISKKVKTQHQKKTNQTSIVLTKSCYHRALVIIKHNKTYQWSTLPLHGQQCEKRSRMYIASRLLCSSSSPSEQSKSIILHVSTGDFSDRILHPHLSAFIVMRRCRSC